MVAVLQFFFVDIGVVDAVDIVVAQDIVVDRAGGLVVLETQGFEESMSTIEAPVATTASIMPNFTMSR